ncbi:MAG: hypothetical protein P1U34_05485 [Coxiellaceae bacterium]|nr:hypothetical protein [Coxiellaceae bacterium]
MPNKYDLREAVHELDANFSQSQRTLPNLCIIIDQLRDLIGHNYTDLDADFKTKLAELQAATHFDFTEHQQLLIDKVVNEAETLYSATEDRSRPQRRAWLDHIASPVTLFSVPQADTGWRRSSTPQELPRHIRRRRLL